jgi:microcin C transport system substrate-binding protein
VADKELDSLIDAYNVEFDMTKRAELSPDPAAHL